MKALTAVLLALLLCERPAAPSAEERRLMGSPGPGRAQAQAQDGAEDEDLAPEGYEDDDEDDEEEGAGGDRGLRCYTCQSLHEEESCRQTFHCPLSQRFCKAILSQWDAESGPLTSYSGWCTDACKPTARTVEGMLMTVTCCQAALCNAPPWQGTGPSGPQGSPGTVAAALLLSLILGSGAVGS